MSINLGYMGFLHEHLSKAQAVPFIGPVLISPIKATIGIIQIVAGIACSIFFLFYAACSCTKRRLTHSVTSLHHAKQGVTSFFYSLANILSAGYLAYRREEIAKHFINSNPPGGLSTETRQ
jgi:hypothetical protein